ncbi:MAG: hypothetical protein PHW04_08585 [Candidatus Wallbacteria bacterium]|nr:hypothetical protein [Candidatus Wallbacteria bacterium]
MSEKSEITIRLDPEKLLKRKRRENEHLKPSSGHKLKKKYQRHDKHRKDIPDDDD